MKQGCVSVGAKVDRLTRCVSFLSQLLDTGVDVRFADLPQIEGATGRFMLQQMASVERLDPFRRRSGGVNRGANEHDTD
jgi:hypothetical protein